MKEKKGYLIEALARQALAHADSKADGSDDKFQQALKNLKDWVDIDGSDKYAALVIRREELAGRYGTVLKLVNKLLNNGKELKDAIRPLSKSELFEKRQDILVTLGYSALVEYDKRTRMISFPKSYMLF